MENAKTIIGIIAGTAAAAVVYLLATAPKKNAGSSNRLINKRLTAGGDMTHTFIGWLEHLKVAIDNEVKHTPQR